MRFDVLLRYRGFNDVTSASGTYYQLWANGVGTINTGSTGLGKFGASQCTSIEGSNLNKCHADYVVSSAKAHGIRLVVALCVQPVSRIRSKTDWKKDKQLERLWRYGRVRLPAQQWWHGESVAELSSGPVLSLQLPRHAARYDSFRPRPHGPHASQTRSTPTQRSSLPTRST